MLHFAPFHMEAPLETGRFSARFNALESGGPAQTLGDILDRIGDNRSALLAELAECSLRDSPNHGREDLRAHIARLHPGAQPANVLVTTGTSEALLLVLLALQPRRVALILPGFQLLSELVQAVGASVVPLTIRWDAAGHPQADVTHWVKTIEQQGPDVVLVNHPHNPSGLVLSRGQLDQLAAAAQRIGASLIGDEHYRFLTPTDPLGATMWQPQREPSAAGTKHIVTGSFIKCLGVPGLRIGWCVAPTQLVAACQNIKNYTTHTVNPLAEWLAERLLRDAALQTFAPMRALWATNRSMLAHWLQTQGRGAGWLGTAPEGGWVTCLTHATLPQTKAHLDGELGTSGCAMLDLELFEWRRFGDPQCALTQSGGFRVGLGMPTADLGTFLSELERIGNTLLASTPGNA